MSNQKLHSMVSGSRKLVDTQPARDKVVRPVLSLTDVDSVEQIIEAVKQLDSQEKRQFLDRLTEGDFEDAWIGRSKPMPKRADSILSGARPLKKSR
jgi:hypothetical protein